MICFNNSKVAFQSSWNNNCQVGQHCLHVIYESHIVVSELVFFICFIIVIHRRNKSTQQIINVLFINQCNKWLFEP